MSGHVVDAADLNEQADQTVWRFTTAAARTAALSGETIPDGALSVLTTGTPVLQVRAGGEWHDLISPAATETATARKFGLIPYQPRYQPGRETGCWTLVELMDAEARGVTGWAVPAVTGAGADVTVGSHVHRVIKTTGTLIVAHGVRAQVIAIGGGGGGGGCGNEHQFENRYNVRTHRIGTGGGGGAGGITSTIVDFTRGHRFTATVGGGGQRGGNAPSYVNIGLGDQPIWAGTNGGQTSLVGTTGQGRVAFAGGGGAGGGSYNDGGHAETLNNLNGRTARSGGGAGIALHGAEILSGAPGSPFGSPPSGHQGGNDAHQPVTVPWRRAIRIAGGSGGGAGSVGRGIGLPTTTYPGGSGGSQSPDARWVHNHVVGGDGISLTLESSTATEYCAGGPARIKGGTSGITTPTNSTTPYTSPAPTLSRGSGGAAGVPSTDGQPGLIVVRYPSSGDPGDLIELEV